MANGESDIATAKATGDPDKIDAAYLAYWKSMKAAKVDPKPRSYFGI